MSNYSDPVGSIDDEDVKGFMTTPQPQQESKLLSNCCNAPLKTWNGDEGTSYYECTRCLKAADPTSKQSLQVPQLTESKFKPLVDKYIYATFQAAQKDPREFSLSDLSKVICADLEAHLATELALQRRELATEISELKLTEEEYEDSYDNDPEHLNDVRTEAIDEVLALLQKEGI